MTFYGSSYYPGFYGSYDPDGGTGPSWAVGIRKWAWNFGDGSQSYCEEVGETPGDGMVDGKTTHEYTTPGCYQLTFTVTDNDAAEGGPPNKTDTYTCWITAVAVDLEIDGVSADDEQAPGPGGFVGVGGLKKINLSLSPTDQPGQAHLAVVGSYKSCVKIWEEQSKTNLVIPDGSDYYKRWDPDDMPDTLWVEGITSSPWRYPLMGLHYMVEEKSAAGDVVHFTVFDVEITSVTLPNDNVSFTTLDAENDISCQADIKPDYLDSTYNSQIEWEIQDNPSVTGNSGDPDDSETGNNVTLTVTAPSASSGRDFKLNYRIRASLTIDGCTCDSEWEEIIQDDKDQLRQLYVDTGYSPIPSRTSSAMVNSSTYVNPGNLSFSELNCNGSSCGNHAYQLDNTVSTVFQTVRDEYGGPIIVTSAYRCPRWNIQVGGTTDSKHTQGNAFDFDNGSTSTNWAVAQSAKDAGISTSKILLYPQTGGGSYKTLSTLETGGYNATNLPSGWTEYNFGHITTN